MRGPLVPDPAAPPRGRKRGWVVPLHAGRLGGPSPLTPTKAAGRDKRPWLVRSWLGRIESVRRIAIVLALFLIAVSCGDDDGGASLIGVWTGAEIGGGAEEWTFTFDATESSVAAEGTEVYRGTYVVHRDENPKQLEFTVTESNFPEYVGETTTQSTSSMVPR